MGLLFYIQSSSHQTSVYGLVSALYKWTMDGFITITDKKVVKFIVNTGTGKIKRQSGQNQISGKK